MNEFISDPHQDAIKGECLAKYSERKPKLFLQIDCWGPKATGDCMCDPSSTGKGMTSVSTWELMHSSPVRILIADDYTDHKLLADLLTEAARWLRESPKLLDEYRAKQWEELPCNVVPF